MIQKLDLNLAADSSDDDSLIKPTARVVEKPVRQRHKGSRSKRSTSDRLRLNSEDIRIAIAYYQANRYHLSPDQEAYYHYLLDLKDASRSDTSDLGRSGGSMSWAAAQYQNSSWKKHPVQRDASSETAKVYEDHHRRMDEKSKAKSADDGLRNGRADQQQQASPEVRGGGGKKQTQRKRDWLKEKLLMQKDGLISSDKDKDYIKVHPQS